MFHSVVLLLSLLVFSSCGDDDNSPSGPALQDSCTNSTVEGFFCAFEAAFSAKDLEALSVLFHENFEFHCLPNDPDDALSIDTLNLMTELEIVRNMFTGEVSPDGIRVLGLSMAIAVQHFVVDASDHDGIAPGESWYKVITEMDVSVIMQDPTADDGSGINNRIVFSNQDFHLRPGPGGGLLLYRQVDRESITKTTTLPVYPGAVEQASWGAIQSLFRFIPEGSIRALIADRFDAAYGGKDIAAYTRLLDDRYEFQNLPYDPNFPELVTNWNRADELRIAGRMFSGWEDPHGSSIISIDIEQRVLTVSASTTSFDDQPAHEKWYAVQAEANLDVLIRSPIPGVDVGVFPIASFQEYIVRPDPADPVNWVIRKQTDGTQIDPEAIRLSSWGSIKYMYQ